MLISPQSFHKPAITQALSTTVTIQSMISLEDWLTPRYENFKTDERKHEIESKTLLRQQIWFYPLKEEAANYLNQIPFSVYLYKPRRLIFVKGITSKVSCFP